MRFARTAAAIAAAALLSASACSTGTEADGASGGSGSAEGPPTGLALLYRGHGGGDPEQDQALVFLDPGSGKEKASFRLPEGAVDPMAPALPAHSWFSEDWNHFVYAPPESPTVQVAQLTKDQKGDYVYEQAGALEAPPAEVWTDPRIHDDRIWFAARAAEGQAGSFQVLSVPLDDPTASPTQEGTVPFDQNGTPSEWAVDPDGALHIRDQAPITQATGPAGEALTVRMSADNLMNASLTAAGTEWQHLPGAPVWGGRTALLSPVGGTAAPSPAQGVQPVPQQQGQPAQQGAQTPEGTGPAGRLITLDETGTAFTETPLLEGEGAVVQYLLSTDRDEVLLQTEKAWYRLPLGEGGEPKGEAEELFEVPRDASMDGFPLAVQYTTKD